MTFLVFSQKKTFIKTSKKDPFSAHLAKFLTPEAKIEKNRTDSLKFRQFSRFSPKLRDSSLTAVNQMVDESGAKLSNGIVISKIDLSNVYFKNIQSAFV